MESKIRAADGAPMWRCDKCGTPKRKKDLHTHSSKKNICKACHEDISNSSRLFWVVSPTVPKPYSKMEQGKRDKIIWKYGRPFFCYYKKTVNRKRFNNDRRRKSFLTKLYDGKKSFPSSMREPVLRAMASDVLDVKTTLWLSLRLGIFTECQQRRLAMTTAEEVVQFTNIGDIYPVVYDVLSQIQSSVDKIDKRARASKIAKSDVVAQAGVWELRHPREAIYKLHTALAAEPFTRPAINFAVETLMSACYVSPRDAVAAVFADAYATFDALRIPAADIMTILSNLVRNIAREELRELDSTVIEHWDGLVEV